MLALSATSNETSKYLDIFCICATTQFPYVDQCLTKNSIHLPSSNLLWTLPTTYDVQISDL
jgi:hypothetical protein